MPRIAVGGNDIPDADLFIGVENCIQYRASGQDVTDATFR